jgi:predicted DNA-binding protein YlxM (UPF0122 family)
VARWIKPFKEDENLPSLSDIDERLEEFESVPLDSQGFNLSHRDRLICLLYTTKETTGMATQEIAEKFEITRQRVYAITRKQEAKAYMSHLNDLMFEELFQDVVREMRTILKKSHSESNKLKAAEMVLKARGVFKNEMTVNVNPHEEVYDTEQKRKEIIDMDLDSIE